MYRGLNLQEMLAHQDEIPGFQPHHQANWLLGRPAYRKNFVEFQSHVSCETIHRKCMLRAKISEGDTPAILEA